MPVVPLRPLARVYNALPPMRADHRALAERHAQAALAWALGPTP